MLNNAFKIVWRNFLKNSSLSIINIMGLAIGITTCLLIVQYVNYELSYDRFYKNADRIYRINTVFAEGNNAQRYATTPPPLAEHIRLNPSNIEATVRVFKWGDFTMRPADDFEKVFRENNLYAADEDFFKVFDFGLLHGDPSTALKERASIVLPKKAAIRYFGEEAYNNNNILGRQIMGGKDGGTPWKVTGVMEDQPDNSHLQFDYLISASTYPDDLYKNQNWSWPIMHTYCLLQEGVNDLSLAQVQKQLNQIVEDQAKPFLNASGMQQDAAVQYLPQKLTDIHLQSDHLREMRPNGNATYVQIFMWVALAILLIACVNYINLFTAQATKRAREVGVKKVLGARKGELAIQFFMESFIFCAFAVLLALASIEVLEKFAAQLFGGNLSLSFLKNGSVLFWAGGLLLLITLLAGAYPAFYLTQFKSVDTLKGKLSSGIKDIGFRNALIVFQFVISIGLIASTLVVNQQVGLFKNKRLGFQKENVVVIENDREIEESAEAFKSELQKHPNISSAGFSNGLPGQAAYMMRDFRIAGKEESFGMNWYQVDYDHLKTMNMKLMGGRGFERDMRTDSSGILLNQAAAKMLGLTDPIGKEIVKNYGAEDEERLNIIGLLEDFHFESLHKEVRPLAIQFFQGFVFKDYIAIRLERGNPESAIAHIQQTWKTFEPGVPLKYSFLDKDYDALYKSEMNLMKIFSGFTALAIVIACLGLFGLAAFITEQRTKEIGVRKVLGASVSNIVGLLTQDFLKLVFIAAVIATPLAWIGMNHWLQDFHYRVDIAWWVFLVAGLSAVAVAFLTISFRSIKAATVNPVKSLKSE